MELWVAGRFHDNNETWEVIGIYSSEEAAVARCHYGNDFVGPITLDEDLTDETVEWPGSYYPVR